MMVSTRNSVLRLLAWQWKYVLFFTACGIGAAVIHFHVDKRLVLPTLPFGIVGGALGIFISFRTNQAYARWWEARQLWGRMINCSRTLASQVLAYMPSEGEGRALAETMVRRQISYVHTLRVMLRLQDLGKDRDVNDLLVPEDHGTFPGDSNAAWMLAHKNHEALGVAAKREMVTPTQMLAIDETLRQIVDVQGGCERIKRTPMPLGYAFIASRMLAAYGMALPFALLNDLGWIAIPVSVIVCLAFALISEAGRILEDPFTMFWNGLPLGALTRTIEVNLRQRLGDKDLPPIPAPDKNGILM